MHREGMFVHKYNTYIHMYSSSIYMYTSTVHEHVHVHVGILQFLYMYNSLIYTMNSTCTHNVWQIADKNFGCYMQVSPNNVHVEVQNSSKGPAQELSNVRYYMYICTRTYMYIHTTATAMVFCSIDVHVNVMLKRLYIVSGSPTSS